MTSDKFPLYFSSWLLFSTPSHGVDRFMDLFCSREEKRREEEAGKKSETNTAERVAHHLLLAHERRHRPRPLLSRFHIPVFRVKHTPQKGKRRKEETGRRGRESEEKGETRGKRQPHTLFGFGLTPRRDHSCSRCRRASPDCRGSSSWPRKLFARHWDVTRLSGV